MPKTDIPVGENVKSSSSSASSLHSTLSSLEHVRSNVSISSSSLSNNDREENAAAVQYEPIVLPKETTLDELLVCHIISIIKIFLYKSDNTFYGLFF